MSFKEEHAHMQHHEDTDLFEGELWWKGTPLRAIHQMMHEDSYWPGLIMDHNHD